MLMLVYISYLFGIESAAQNGHVQFKILQMLSGRALSRAP